MFVLQDGRWRVYTTTNTSDGRKVYYKCNESACGAEVFLLYKAETYAVVLYTSGEHTLSQEVPKRGIHPNTKKIILQLFNDGIQKPRAIILALRNRGCTTLPSNTQLKNYLSTMKTTKFGRHSISLGELEAWAEKRRLLPEDEDEVFVCGFESDAGLSGLEFKYFRIAVSTKRLLKLGSRAQNIHADATYKLIWQGFPVLIVGYSDQNRKFHPLVLAVTVNETKFDFSFLFSSVIHGVSLATDNETQFNPTHIIADAAPAIRNGFALAFGHEAEKVIMCWAHVVMNVDKQLVKIKSKEVRASVRDNICLLQTCPNEDAFLHASELFLQKWKVSVEEGVSAFVAYFESSWLDQNSTWYEGYAPGCPSTNNCLEATNLAIKRQNTLRERLEMSRFLGIVENDIVKSWSMERAPNTTAGHTQIAEAPDRTLKMWTTAYQWATSRAESLKTGNTIFVGSSTLDKDLKTAIRETEEKAESSSWADFDDYATCRRSVYKITIDENKFFCNCSEFLKCYVCHHSMGMEIRLKVTIPPAQAKNIPIGQKRKRGRPKLSRPALIRQ